MPRHITVLHAATLASAIAVLLTASPARIKEAHGRYGKDAGVTLPSELTHDGIEDATEKGSAILYCHEGKWLRLAGSD